MAAKKSDSKSRLAEIKEQVAANSECRYKPQELEKGSFYITDAELGEGEFGEFIKFHIQPEGKSKGTLTLAVHEKRMLYYEAFQLCTTEAEKQSLSKEFGRMRIRQIPAKKKGYNPSWIFSKVDEEEGEF